MNRPLLLIVTRHYPPEISGGARRPFLIAQGLRERGHRVVVAAPFAPVGEPDWIRTPHPAAERGHGSTGGGAPVREPGWKTRLRQMMRWPDNEIGWASQAVRAVMASGLRPDWVMTTSPPESAHSAGERLKRATGARWLLEMRDSWIEEPLRPELIRAGLRRTVEEGLARRWIAGADARVAVSHRLAAEMQKLSPDAASPLSVIGHFAEAPPAAKAFGGAGPHLLHTGSFSLSHASRRLTDLLAAFGRLQAHIPSARLHLAGRLTTTEHAELALAPLSSSVTLHGEVSYAEARALQAGADALVLCQQGIDSLPGKLGEYLECTAPILTVGEGSWKSRIEHIPHWPVEDAAAAFAAPKRPPAGAMAKAVDAYEEILNSQPAI